MVAKTSPSMEILKTIVYWQFHDPFSEQAEEINSLWEKNIYLFLQSKVLSRTILQLESGSGVLWYVLGTICRARH